MLSCRGAEIRGLNHADHDHPGQPQTPGQYSEGALGWIEEHVQANGHGLDRANILDYNLAGCRECLACKKAALELCSIDDDANALFRRMAAADLVLIAVPVFCWGFPAQIKGLIDRMFCMMDFAGERPAPSTPRQADGHLAHRRRGGS